MAKKYLPVGTHALAARQAIAHANIARSMLAAIEQPGAPDNDPGELLALLMNAAFSVELFFKALMLGARNGEVTLGHPLVALLEEFPAEFRESFEAKYARWAVGRETKVHYVALRLSASAPETPDHTPSCAFASFTEAIASLSDVFVKARYFFEEVKPEGWAIIVLPEHSLIGILETLEASYQDLLAGRFGALE
ncbi:hypothetical protein [Pseudoduganella namucuonensis]|uniref:hypothetical protein n=1 Tax=Pseudoduganella namucuonensis TaxID=1035707 RepID=UPI0011607220|nr:hypothetical protein [Pseudoduganella namucuonensis]